MAFDANDLSPHEHFVVERIRAGEVADFTAMAGAGGAKPSVRAGFLRKLILGLDPAWTVHPPGVRLRGARIEGALDLTDCSGAGLPALALIECDIPEPADLSHARLARLSLRGSRLVRLIAVETEIGGELDLRGAAPLGEPGHEMLTADLRGARIDGDLLARGARFARALDSTESALALDDTEIAGNLALSDGFEAFGAASLVNARIRGALQCQGAQLLNRADDGAAQALDARGAALGALHLSQGFKAEGEMHFAGARIDADVDLRNGSLRNEFGAALNLANAEIGGEMVADGAKVAGQVALQGASIARNFDLRGVELAHPTTPRGRDYGRALEAASLTVGGAALMQGANIKGEVFLADARIGGYLAFGGGRFINGGGWAIRAPNVRVGGNVTFKLSEGFTPHGHKTVIEGGAKFDRARIEGGFAWQTLELRGPGPEGAKGAVFSFSDAVIAGAVRAHALTTQQDAFIDASGAQCATLDDDLENGWGVAGAPIDLHGFAYARIDSAGERWRARLNWLKRSRRDGRFSPQPFSHAAQVYARAGRREDARRILLAQHDLRTVSAASGPLTWAFSSLFGLIAGYGLAPIRVARALILFLALGVGGVLAMNAQGALVTPQGQACNGAVEPALYAVDVALPLIDLGQQSRCAPGRTVRADMPAGIEVSAYSDWRLFEGVALWRWAHALYALIGAVLAALAIITFSGVMKPKD